MLHPKRRRALRTDPNADPAVGGWAVWGDDGSKAVPPPHQEHMIWVPRELGRGPRRNRRQPPPTKILSQHQGQTVHGTTTGACTHAQFRAAGVWTAPQGSRVSVSVAGSYTPGGGPVLCVGSGPQQTTWGGRGASPRGCPHPWTRPRTIQIGAFGSKKTEDHRRKGRHPSGVGGGGSRPHALRPCTHTFFLGGGGAPAAHEWHVGLRDAGWLRC